MENENTPAEALETGADTAAPAGMKFKIRTKIGVDGGPGIGVTTKTVSEDISADTLQDCMTKSLQSYVEKYGREPSEFAQFSMTIALDTANV